MRAMELVIGAVNVILKQLGELPDGPEARGLRERALGYIQEAAMWNTARPSIEMLEATMKNVLFLHVVVRKLGADNPRAGYAGGLESYGRADLEHRQVACSSASTPDTSGVASVKATEDGGLGSVDAGGE